MSALRRAPPWHHAAKGRARWRPSSRMGELRPVSMRCAAHARRQPHAHVHTHTHVHRGAAPPTPVARHTLLFVVTLPTLSRLRCTAASMCSVSRGTAVYQLQSFHVKSNQLLCLRSPQARTAPPPAPRGTVFIVWTRVDFLVSLVAKSYSYSGPRSLGGRPEATHACSESEAIYYLF